jgi:hypothetical protein
VKRARAIECVSMLLDAAFRLRNLVTNTAKVDLPPAKVGLERSTFNYDTCAFSIAGHFEFGSPERPETVSKQGILTTEKMRAKLLEVFIEKRGARSWEWRVHFGDHVLNSGVEETLPGARFSGNAALFRILVSAPGWDE